MFKIFFSPKVRFQQLSTSPEWSLPLTLSLILPLFLGTISVALLPKTVLIQSTANRIERVKSFIDEQVARGKMPSDQREAALERIEQTARSEFEFYERSGPATLLFRFLVRSLPALVWSLIQLLIFTALLNLLIPVLGAGSSFGRMLAVTANSALIRTAGAVFHGVLMFATGKLTVNTSLSLLVPNSPLFIKALLTAIDIFTVWELVLVSLGIGVLFNLPARRTAAAVFSIWLLYVILLALLSSLSGGLALPA
ncbi:MAG: YIP1 family protein [candidate division WOR-3 bacterium]